MIRITVEFLCDAEACDGRAVATGSTQADAPVGWFQHEGKLYCSKHELRTTTTIVVPRQQLPDLSRQ